jgi:hypothetical protein
VPSSTKKEQKDGTIAESSTSNSRREIKFFSTPESSYSVKENYGANGKDPTPSSTLRYMARSPSKMMMITFSKLTVNV